LVNAPCGAIAFRFEKLTIWGDQALVARLSPADESSSELLRKLSDARNNLGNEAKRELGIGTTSSYSPHVSLGYFANREHGRLARSHLLEWTDTVRESVKNSSIAVSSLSVYAFTDMASFYKRATTSPTSNGAGNGE
jgi:hypothetical protein